MAVPAEYKKPHPDVLFTTLAREIAIDHYPIETILSRYQIPAETWNAIKRNPRFTQLLEHETQVWNSALNTEERTKLKAAAMVEDFLPEAHAILHRGTEALNGRVELAKLVTRIAGMGTTNVGVEGGSAERFQVTINLGADAQLKFAGELPPKTIDAEPLE